MYRTIGLLCKFRDYEKEDVNSISKILADGPFLATRHSFSKQLFESPMTEMFTIHLMLRVTRRPAARISEPTELYTKVKFSSIPLLSVLLAE